jgi:hypothetical protein
LIKHEQAYEMGMIAIRSLWCLLFVLAQVALLPFLILYRKNSTTYNQIYDFMTAYRILLALIIAGGLFWNVGEGVRLMNDVWVAATATAEKPVSEQGPGGSQSSGAMPTVGTATRCRSPC